MDRLFVDQLKQLCREHPTRAKWVIVPSHAVGRTIGDRLAREGTDWVNVRFVTPLDLALRMGAPFLVERGIDPSEEGLGPALLMRLLLALPEGAGYFRPLATQPDLAMAVWSTMRELRMAGIKAANLHSEGFVSSEKHTELSTLLSSYEAYLVRSRRGDRATVFEEALQHLNWSPLKAIDIVVELPDVRWQPLERQLLDRLPGDRLDLDQKSDADTSFRAHEFFTAGGADAEVEEVFRRILAAKAPLDEVELVAPTPELAALIWEKAIRFEWPVTVAHGLPVALTRPGRALRAFLEWIDDDFAAGQLRRLLQSGDVRLDALAISPARAARVLVKARAAWGRETFQLSLARYAASNRRRAERDDMPADQRESLLARATEAEALASWIDGLVASVPIVDEAGTVSVREMAACARAFVEECAASVSALDRMSIASLASAIGELNELEDFRGSFSQALQFLDERVKGLRVGADRPRPGHLHVSTLATAGYAGRASVFVMGLEEGRVFPVPSEDPILLDRERQGISADLRLSHARTDDAVALGRARLADISRQPGVRVTFSYSCRDLREYRQTYASWVMLAAFRESQGKPDATYQHLHQYLEDEVGVRSCVPDNANDALDASRWWLHGVVSSGPGAKPDVLKAYPSLADGIQAEEARESDAFTEYDGFVPAAGTPLDPCHPDRVVSPTQLEDAAKCGFRYFLRYGLGVDAIESGERDRDVWLDPLLRGVILHDLYAELLRRTRGLDRRPTVKDDHAWMQARGTAALTELAREMPPPSEEVRLRETKSLLRDLAVFVEAEEQCEPSRSAVGLEVGFGRGGSSDLEPLSQEQPIVIDLGQGLKVKVAGRIDRIDCTGKTTFEIVDYKTGGYWKDDWAGTFAGGKRLQHALYGLAAAELLRRTVKGAKVTGAQYYFPSEKGGQVRKVIDAQPLATTGQVIADLRRVIVDGLFLHAADKRACSFCDYGGACGARPVERAAAKLADARLDGLRRLTTHG